MQDKEAKAVLIPKPNIASIPIYEPGRPIEEIKRLFRLKSVIKLASNENPLGPSPLAADAIARSRCEIHRYPDGSGFSLKRAIARRCHINPSNLILGNGTNEILHMICLTYLRRGDEIIFCSPTFSIYEMEGLIQEAKIKKVRLKDFRFDLEAISSGVTRRTVIVFIANPNNPTGTFVTRDEVRDFMKKIPPHVLVVFDEAYAEYAPPNLFPDTLKYVRENRDVIVLRTFSKIYGLAGLRIGYGMAKACIIKTIEHVRQPFNTNTIAQRAACRALYDYRHVKKSFELNRKGILYLSAEFKRLGLKYVPSGANFIMVHIGKMARRIFERLLSEGVIVRPLVGELCEYIRVTTGTPRENVIFIKKLEKCLRDIKNSNLGYAHDW